uniref:TSA: Tityus bahiensis Tbah02708 mRNA sequence n=1 Tax=Tityus bahiensis TaxID=50343 RepID=A0A0C9S399_TITBA
MKSALAVVSVILLLEMEKGEAKDGYAVGGDRCRVRCSPLGKNKDCETACRKKAGSYYGYCYLWFCYCENVSKSAVVWGNPTLGPCLSDG